MQTKWIKIIGAAVVIGALAVTVVGAVAFAQGPGPTTTPTPGNSTIPNNQIAPNNQPGYGPWGMGPGMHGGPRGGGMMAPGAFGGMGPGMMQGRDFDDMGRGMMGQNSLFSATATALGTTESNLFTQLQQGKTVADLAKDKNVDTAKLVSDYLATVKTNLQSSVSQNRLTQAQADALLALQKANADVFLNYKFNSTAVQPGWGMFGHGGWNGQLQSPQQQQQQAVPQGTPQAN
jgi:hypothetical protein